MERYGLPGGGNYQVTEAKCYFFKGDRIKVRQQAIIAALEGLIKRGNEELAYHDQSNYFFALWPNEKTAQQLHQRMQLLSEPHHGKPVPIEKLHMTLSYLGQLPNQTLQAVCQLAETIRNSPFELQVNHADYWGDIQLRWLGIMSTPPNLLQLAAHLKRLLITVGCKVDKKPFMPHITVARKCSKHFKPELVSVLSWKINEFYLVKSVKKGGFSKYEIIQRWKLG